VPAKGGFDRRKFLKGAAGAAAGALGFPYIVPSSVFGGNGLVAPSDKIIIGCIGVGGQGMTNLKAFLKFDDVRVKAVCDVSKSRDYTEFYWRYPGAGREPAKAEVEQYYRASGGSGARAVCDAYTDFRELLADKEVDAVSVCTPDHWHGLISVAAAKAGKDIYCEKPLTNTIAEGRAVCDAVARYGRILQTGSHERSNDTVRYACELIQNGRIGKLHTIRVNMPNTDSHHKQLINGEIPENITAPHEGLDYNFWLGHTPEVPYSEYRVYFYWRFIMAHGGGEMTDRGAHIIDIGQLGNGTDDTGPVEISAKGRTFRDSVGMFDTFIEYDFECKYANGVRLIGSTATPRGVKFEGTDGWIFVHVHGGRLEASDPMLLREHIDANEKQLGRSPGHHRNFLDAVRTRHKPVATAEIGHRTASICHLVNIALTTGRPLKWDPVKEQIIGDAETNGMLSRPMRSPWELT
jgi:predicted dehydrogenase